MTAQLHFPNLEENYLRHKFPFVPSNIRMNYLPHTFLQRSRDILGASSYYAVYIQAFFMRSVAREAWSIDFRDSSYGLAMSTNRNFQLERTLKQLEQ